MSALCQPPDPLGGWVLRFWASNQVIQVLVGVASAKAPWKLSALRECVAVDVGRANVGSTRDLRSEQWRTDVRTNNDNQPLENVLANRTDGNDAIANYCLKVLQAGRKTVISE